MSKEDRRDIDYFNAVAAKYASRSKSNDQEEETPPQPPTARQLFREGNVIHLERRSLQGSVKLEQNLGCELPVCVSNRKHVKNTSIEFTSPKGARWELVRGAKKDDYLPAPEHYPVWLWLLDRLKRAAEKSDKLPTIELDPAEYFDMFGVRPGGTQYKQLDEAARRFAGLTVRGASMLWDAREGRPVKADEIITHLCSYRSWRDDDNSSSRGLIRPSEFLWESIKADYLKSIRLRPMIGMSYIALRLYVYLQKHVSPGGTFGIKLINLLPKIPVSFALDQAKTKLTPAHNELARAGLLEPIDPKGKKGGVVYTGRKEERLVTYRRRDDS